ncbi:MAG: TonB-dependent receptor [Nibricoccus sp.]
MTNYAVWRGKRPDADANGSLLNELLESVWFAKNTPAAVRVWFAWRPLRFPAYMTTPLVFVFPRLVRLALPAFVAGAALLTAYAVKLDAQVAPAAVTSEEPDVELETYVVTGSAVPLPKGEQFQPLTEISKEAIEDTGAATPIEGLRLTLPGFLGNVNTEQRANGGTGAAGVNLRGLGGTLTLLDGRRTVLDELNMVPMIALQGFEVVKDGASARYGADALTGVFNTKLVTSFRGGRVQGYYGNTTEEDAGVVRVGALVGAGTAKTEIIVGAEYYHRNALMSRDREISATADARAQGGLDMRSAVVSTRIYAAVPPAGYNYLVLAPGLSAGYNASHFVTQASAGRGYDFRTLTASIPEQENRSVFVRLNQKILSDGVLEAYARLVFVRDEYDSVVSTTPLDFYAATPHTVTGMAVYFSPSQTYMNIRPDVIGPRGRNFQRDIYDFQAGLKGRIGDNWSWDAAYVYGWWYRDDLQTNSFSSAQLFAELASGNYNPFAQDSASGVSPNTGRAFDNPAALARAAVSGTASQDAGVRGVEARVNGRLLDLPAGALAVATGYDYYLTERNVAADGFTVTSTAAIPPYYGFNTAGFSTAESTSNGVYAEVVVPLVGKKQGIPGVNTLSLSASARYSANDLKGTVNDAAGIPQMREARFEKTTPKIGVIYKPCDALLVRSTYAQGYRAPALSAIYGAPSSGAQAIIDPLGFTTATTLTVSTQGNPDLQAEESETLSAGFAFTPKAVKGLKLEVDYYNDVTDHLVVDGAQYILNVNAATQGAGFTKGNASTINPNAAYATLITRNPTTGAITALRSMRMNLSSREASGVDGTLTYEWPLQPVRLMTRVDWNTLISWDLVPVETMPTQNWLGKYVDVTNNAISPGSIPRNRGRISQLVGSGPWTLLAGMNYVSHLEDDRARTQGGQFRYVGSWTTIDAQLGYRWKKAGLDVRVGVSNLTDVAAPFAAGAVNSVNNDSYDVTTHSNRGRFVYTQVTKSF